MRILDPACGSGNFLYLALQAVKDIEYRAILECETLGLGMIVPRVGPEILHGIEINPFAAELARTTIWIGDIQWRVKNAITHHPRPILRKLDAIECRDALLTADGKGGFKEAEWPEADCIIGNPPFLGDRKMIRAGSEKTTSAFTLALSRTASPVPLISVCYWLQRRLDAIAGRHELSELGSLRLTLSAAAAIPGVMRTSLKLVESLRRGRTNLGPLKVPLSA